MGGIRRRGEGKGGLGAAAPLLHIMSRVGNARSANNRPADEYKRGACCFATLWHHISQTRVISHLAKMQRWPMRPGPPLPAPTGGRGAACRSGCASAAGGPTAHKQAHLQSGYRRDSRTHRCCRHISALRKSWAVSCAAFGVRLPARTPGPGAPPGVPALSCPSRRTGSASRWARCLSRDVVPHEYGNQSR